jgi:uncharacterized protein YqeY
MGNPGIEEKLLLDMKTAMKERDKLKLETIRGLRSQLKNASIDKRDNLTEEEVIQVLSGAVKKRKESIEQFKMVGRDDRAEIETQELNVIQNYLPQQLTQDEIIELVDSIISEVQADSLKDLGKVMSFIMPKIKGRAEGKIVQNIVRDKLSTL